MNQRTETSGYRIVGGIGMVVVSSVAAIGVYVLGMLLLSFAGGIHAAPNIPRSYELTMLLLWPGALAVTAILPGLLLLGGATWEWPLRIAIAGGSLCFLWWVLAMGLMMGYGSKSVVKKHQVIPPPMMPQVQHDIFFSLTEKECEEQGLAPVAFALSWPNHVRQVNGGRYQSFYIRLQRVNESGEVVEALELSPASGIGAEHDSKSGAPHPSNIVFDELVEKTKESLGAKYRIHVAHYSWDRLHTGRQIQADRQDAAESHLAKSVLQFILSPPVNREDGILCTLRAYDLSEVKNCIEFESVGMPQGVLASFHWLERD